MITYSLRAGAMAFPLVLLAGCSSLQVHEDDWGHPYGGTEKAVKALPCGLAISSMALFLPAPFILADVPASLVVDTVLLPADLLMPVKRPRATVTRWSEHGGCH